MPIDNLPLDPKIVRKMKEEVEKRLLLNELKVLEYWRGELEKVLKKAKTLSGVMNDMASLIKKIENREKVIKSQIR